MKLPTEPLAMLPSSAQLPELQSLLVHAFIQIHSLGILLQPVRDQDGHMLVQIRLGHNLL
jgi:hypothetical protein